MIPPLWQKVKRNQLRVLMTVKLGSEKAYLKLSIQKTKLMASSTITSWQIDGKTMETVRDFIFGGTPKSLQMVTTDMKLRHLLLERKAMTKLDSILRSGDITLRQRSISSKLWFFQ